MYTQKHTKKILLSGGGTGGSVTPLLAVKEKLKEEGGCEFLWVGTWNGVEREIIKNEGVEFYSIAGGKLRRYFDWKNFGDPLKVIVGFFQSLFLLRRWKPDIILSAGSFVSVPVAWAGWILRIPVLIHQQDIRPGLANKLMSPVASKVTVTFQESVSDYGKKAIWTGNPTRETLTKGGEEHNIPLVKEWPTVLVVGGGTGSAAINKMINDGIDELLDVCQVVHIAGKEKMNKTQLEQGKKVRYFCYEFLEPQRMMGILRAADVVVSRAGLGFLTELSYIAKPSIIIPIPDSHQEDNARILRKKDAAIILDQAETTSKTLVDKIKKLLNNKELRSRLSSNMGRVMKREGSENVVEVIKKIIK